MSVDAARRSLTLLLPARARLAGALDQVPVLARILARGDGTPTDAGDEAQLQRVFDILPRGLPVAALTREHDCADAGHAMWLRADPAHVRVDLGAGRMLACGELGLAREEVEALLQPLKPVFGDAGCPISAGAPSRWYVTLPRDAKLPGFVAPHRVLGDDIFAHLPEGELGRRWRGLMNEAQVILHHHPLNAQRIAQGKLPVNSLWFWGAGILPDHVRCHHVAVCSDDLLLAVLAKRAGARHHQLPLRPEAASLVSGALFDLRRVRAIEALDKDWITPAIHALARGAVECLQLDFSDGRCWRYRHANRWRFWRRPPAAWA